MMRALSFRRRLTAAATALGTLVVIVVLLTGVPYVLWGATGAPWPDRVASWNEFGQRLVQPVGDPLAVELLATAAWVCWAAFTWTVIREVVWYAGHLPRLLRDCHAHREHVASLSVKGSLAALCIGTFVVALISLWRPPRQSAPTNLAVQVSFGRRLSRRARCSPRLPPGRRERWGQPGSTSSTWSSKATRCGTSRTDTWETRSSGPASTR